MYDMARNKEFMPTTTKEGYRGFYPTTNQEWGELPLPMRVSKWDSFVSAVIFVAWFDNYKIRARVSVHPDNVFKALVSSSEGGTQLYTVVGAVIKKGYNPAQEICAEWSQDTHNGTFSIVNYNGKAIGTQGGYNDWLPENCYKNEAGLWQFNYMERDDGWVYRSCLV
jgi:hypothetical protein